MPKNISIILPTFLGVLIHDLSYVSLCVCILAHVVAERAWVSQNLQVKFSNTTGQECGK